jgi:hypothetical protein
MALLVNNLATQKGSSSTMVGAAAGGDTCHPKPNGVLHVKNTGAETTVTIPATIDSINLSGMGDVPIENIVVVVPATTGEKFIYIPPQSHGAGGSAAINYSQVTGVTVQYIELERP